MHKLTDDSIIRNILIASTVDRSKISCSPPKFLVILGTRTFARVPTSDKNRGTVVVESVRVFSTHCVVKYKVDSLRFKDVRSIIDPDIKESVEIRFEKVGNNDKAFQQSLSERSLTHYKTGMPIKTVRCDTGLKAESLVTIRHDESGKAIAFAKSGNNHHVAIYRTEDGEMLTSVVSFWSAVKRKMAGVPVLVSNVNQAWDILAYSEDNDVVREVANSLPPVNSELVIDMKIGDMFILGMSDDEFSDAISSDNQAQLCSHLYRVQKASKNDYYFRLHLETRTDGDPKLDTERMAMYRITSTKGLMELCPRKVKVSPIGKISYD